jgi:hypothetical protein
MEDKRQQYIAILEEFKNLVISYGRTRADTLRTAIVKKSSIVQKLVHKAQAGRTITIAPPPAVGGVIIRNANPFDLIFQDFYGVDIIGTVVDCIDEAIGRIEHDEGFSVEPKPNKNPSQSTKNDLTTNVTITKEISKILGMPQEAFWPLLVAIVGASFYIGLRFGQAKFDGEKIDLYNSNLSYKAQNYNLLKQLGIKQRHERELKDSLNVAEDKLNAAHRIGK